MESQPKSTKASHIETRQRKCCADIAVGIIILGDEYVKVWHKDMWTDWKYINQSFCGIQLNRSLWKPLEFSYIYMKYCMTDYAMFLFVWF